MPPEYVRVGGKRWGSERHETEGRG
jgi:hypothetical protein